jgi:hypothetical protein
MNRDVIEQRREVRFENAHDDKVPDQRANQIRTNQTPTPSDAIQLQLLEMMKQMQSEITELKKNKTTGGTFSGSNKPPFVAKYCWSHGACGHTSKECTKKKDGHNDDATFKDKKGGRTWRCA